MLGWLSRMFTFTTTNHMPYSLLLPNITCIQLSRFSASQYHAGLYRLIAQQAPNHRPSQTSTRSQAGDQGKLAHLSVSSVMRCLMRSRARRSWSRARNMLRTLCISLNMLPLSCRDTHTRPAKSNHVMLNRMVVGGVHDTRPAAQTLLKPTSGHLKCQLSQAPDPRTQNP